MLVYNLEVDDFHSYFVGDEPILVHNDYGKGDWNHHDKLYNQAQDKKLKDIIDQLYRIDAHIGDGGTADMLRYEFASGDTLKHLQKAEDRIRQLTKMLSRTDLCEGDIKLIYSLLGDLHDAVKMVLK